MQGTQNNMESLFNTTVKNWTKSLEENRQDIVEIEKLKNSMADLKDRVEELQVNISSNSDTNGNATEITEEKKKLPFTYFGEYGGFYILPRVYNYEEGKKACEKLYGSNIIEFTNENFEKKAEMLSTYFSPATYYIGKKSVESNKNKRFYFSSYLQIQPK